MNVDILIYKVMLQVISINISQELIFLNGTYI